MPSSTRSSFLFHPCIVLAAIALAGSLLPVAPLPASLLASIWAGLYLFCRREPSSPRVLFSGVLISVFLLSAWRADREVDSYRSSYFRTARSLDGPRRCAFEARVLTSPTIRSRTEKKGKKQTLLFTAEAKKMDCEGKVLTGPLVVRLYGEPLALSRDDHVEGVAQLAPTRLFRNAPLSDPWPGATRRGATLSGSVLHATRIEHGTSLKSFIDRQRLRVRKRIQATYSGPSESLGRALVLGENDLDDEEAEAFRDSGLLHLLAVSGTHLVIAVAALVQILRALFVRISWIARRWDTTRMAAAAGALLSLVYADFSGGSGSAWRAAYMLCVVFGGRALGFRLGGAQALGSSILIGIALDPLRGADYSFLLSALATSGLIGLGQPLSRLYEQSRFNRAWLRPLVLSLVATVSSTIVCSPILSMMDDEMTLAALFANVVAAPLGELIALPACLLHSIVAFLPSLESGLATLGSGALHGVREVALWSASVKSAQFEVPFPSSWNVVSLLAGVLLVVHLPAWKWKLASLGVPLAISASSGLLPSEHGPLSEPDSLSVTALDVGQGDALFLEFPSGGVGLMDGGGFATGIPDTGKRVVLPYLRARGIRSLDLTVLSHAHPDHLLGLLSVLDKVKTKELWIPEEEAQAKGGLKELILIARRGGALIRGPRELCKKTARSGFEFGGGVMEILSPCDEVSPPFGKNDASLVLRISHGNRKVLLTGDIEKAAEQQLVGSKGKRLRADFLKVGHHGSDTSTTEAFLSHVRPRTAFISCGIRNRYEHPRPSTLARLSSHRVAVFRTDEYGSLTYRTDGEREEVFISSPP